MSVSNADRAIAKHIAGVFGGTPKVRRHYTDDESSFIDVMTCADVPQSGVSSFSTLGLARYPLLREGVELPTRIEIVGAIESTVTDFDSAIATAAFYIARSKWFCAPGVIFPDIVRDYGISTTLEHFFFTDPFLWEALSSKNFGDVKVSWLLAIPISEQEREYAKRTSSGELEKLFQSHQIDIFDKDRPSVV